MTELARRFCFRPRPHWWPAVLVLLLNGLGPGCAPPAADPDKIRCDGSSTVFLITEAVVEEFARTHPAVKVTVGVSGTGGGFKKFSRGEIDLVNASRPIAASKARACRQQGIAYAKIEELIQELRAQYTIVIVTHNLAEAVRVSDHTVFFNFGSLVKYGPTKELFEAPREELTRRYVAGKFG